MLFLFFRRYSRKWDNGVQQLSHRFQSPWWVSIRYCITQRWVKSKSSCFYRNFAAVSNEYALIFIAVPCLKPKSAVCDFETALFCSVKFNFGSEIKSCLFQYRQAIWRTWQQLGLSVSKEKSFSSWFKLIMSLPLLPETLLGPTLQELAPSIVFDQPIKVFWLSTFMWKRPGLLGSPLWVVFLYMVKNAGRIQMWVDSIRHYQNVLVEKDQAFGFSWRNWRV